MSADRHSSYKSLAKEGALQIAFCWAHVRRDFILLAKEREVHQGWAEQWLAGIAELYRWHRRRQQALVRERSDRQWSWSGPESEMWEGRRRGFESLLNDSDHRIAQIGRTGVKYARANKQAAIRRETEEAVRGHY